VWQVLAQVRVVAFQLVMEPPICFVPSMWVARLTPVFV
jgi:hypothetical protein